MPRIPKPITKGVEVTIKTDPCQIEVKKETGPSDNVTWHRSGRGRTRINPIIPNKSLSDSPDVAMNKAEPEKAKTVTSPTKSDEENSEEDILDLKKTLKATQDQIATLIEENKRLKERSSYENSSSFSKNVCCMLICPTTFLLIYF